MTTAATSSAPPPVRDGQRLLRVGVLGGSSMSLATGGHLLGGGQLPSAGVLAVTAVLLGMGALTITARRVRFPALLVLLGLEQLLTHLLFSAAAGSNMAACQTMNTASGHHPGGLGSQLLASCAGSDAVAGQMSTHGWPMLAAHAVATVLTGWLLARGEAQLWALTERMVEAATAVPSGWPQSSPRTRTVLVATMLGPLPRSAAAPRAPPAPSFFS